MLPKMLDVVKLVTGEKGAVVWEYSDTAYIVEIPPDKNGEDPRIIDVKLEEIDEIVWSLETAKNS